MYEDPMHVTTVPEPSNYLFYKWIDVLDLHDGCRGSGKVLGFVMKNILANGPRLQKQKRVRQRT